MGIATAFGAPIGGLLFAFEELASASFRQALGWQIFFACMISVLVLDTLRSAQNTVMQGNHFGLFDGKASTIYFEVSGRQSCVYERHVTRNHPSQSVPHIASPLQFVLYSCLDNKSMLGPY